MLPDTFVPLVLTHSPLNPNLRTHKEFNPFSVTCNPNDPTAQRFQLSRFDTVKETEGSRYCVVWPAIAMLCVELGIFLLDIDLFAERFCGDFPSKRTTTRTPHKIIQGTPNLDAWARYNKKYIRENTNPDRRDVESQNLGN